jgi:LAS superfamily LD-carboxypeptidase LdcB
MSLGFVLHQWMVEGNKLKMSPISIEGMNMHLARPETVNAFNRMAKDAERQGVRLKIIWAFRSSNLQKQHYEQAQQKHGKRKAIRWVAPPGYSEHQTGWALDIGDEADPKADDNPLFERTAAFRWLSKNARNYGFELSFPPKNWQGISYEPWHWRYVGTPEAHATFHPKGIAAVGVWGISFLEAVRCWIRG